MIDDAGVRAFVFRTALTSGAVPAAAGIAGAFSVSVPEVRASLARLMDAHMLVLQPGGDEILMAMPFSAVPTTFAVEAAGIRTYGNCIWDALGVLVMMRRDGVVRASCGCCGTAMSLHVRGDALIDRDGVAHFGVPARQWWDDIAFT